MSDYAWSTGGIEEFVSVLLTGLDREQYDCTLVTWQHSTPLTTDTTVIALENGDVRPLHEVIRKTDYVIFVTSFNVRLLCRAALDALQGSNIKVITIIQTSTHSDPKASSISQQESWLDQIIQASDITVCVSDAVKVNVARILSQKSAESKIITIENGARLLDTQTYTRGRTRVSFIGRPTHAKGFDLFMRLVDDFGSTDIKFAANTVSIPPPVADPRVDWSWQMDKEKLKEFFASSDLLVVPYRSADGLPLAVLEAINCGMPIMALDSQAVTPLAHRYKQPVIKQDYASLKRALLKWHSGKLSWSAPVGGSVPSLSEQVDAYLDVMKTL